MAERRADLNLPMRLQCNTCDHIMSNGTQLNSRVEQVIGETYLGIKILRFHIQCTNCTGEIKFKTDPKNAGFIIESVRVCWTKSGIMLI
ncbi:predicted protein [Arabidopsis lyrata subsp. lyrata]|uniref:Predicted protein n=1 Tax=Arabidopsis lyrata subsp. lyrata TaxID=81972 RepID=D7MY07_ARALL|nr:predicted protein [Arabidopsis lyrata subsp. lyrata]